MRAGLAAAFLVAAALLGACIIWGPSPRQQAPNSCGPVGSACWAGHLRGTCTSDGWCTPNPCALGLADCCGKSSDCAGAGPGSDLTVACDTDDGACKTVCATSADCAGSVPHFGDCIGAACICDSGVCSDRPCSGDGDCRGGRLCLAGTCQVAERAATCDVAPREVTVAPGVTQRIGVLAWSSAGRSTPGSAWPLWRLGDPSLGTIGETGELVGGASAGTTTITAKIDEATCAGRMTSIGARAPSALRVRTIDPTDGGPVPGVLVRVRQGATTLGSARTGADGVASVPGVPDAVPVDVDVLDVDATSAPNGRAFVTVLGTDARTLLVPLPANPDPADAAGISGEMTEKELDGLAVGYGPPAGAYLGYADVRLSVVGLSYPGDPTELDLPSLAGPFTTVHIHFASLIDSDADLYSGVVVGIGTDLFKPWYAPVGAAGRRTVWALGEDLSLTDATTRWATYINDPTTMPAGGIAFVALPLLARRTTWSAVRTSVDVPSLPLADGKPDFTGFPTAGVTFDTRLRRDVLVTAPPLPALPPPSPYGHPWLDSELFLAGVFVPGQGFVPLGLTIAPDVRESDGWPDGVVENDSGRDLPDGVVDLRFAPPGGALDRFDVVAMVIAADSESIAGGDRGDGARAGRLETLGPVGFGRPFDMSAPLLDLPVGATYAGRVATATFPDADAHRAILTDRGGHRWIVWAPPGASRIAVPEVTYVCQPTSCSDPGVAPVRVEVQAITFGSSLGYDDVMRLDGTDLDRLPELMSGFSTIDAQVTAP